MSTMHRLITMQNRRRPTVLVLVGAVLCLCVLYGPRNVAKQAEEAQLGGRPAHEDRKLERADGVFYFGYGSNLAGTRLRLNAPSARFVTIAKLEDHCLKFTVYSSRWRGGAADVQPCQSGIVLGAVWSISVADLPALDRQESVPEGLYRRELVTVQNLHAGNRSLPALLYRVKNPVEGLLPSKLYLEVICAGARAIGMPAWYMSQLRAVKANQYYDGDRFQFYTRS
mmetsp:Transcript_12187/g.37165  ORF Transcript_12187/g.37165 Transcript_12187/m.37165 type:complete len:226 (+) Transcript_12187:198-875(+)